VDLHGGGVTPAGKGKGGKGKRGASQAGIVRAPTAGRGSEGHPERENTCRVFVQGERKAVQYSEERVGSMKGQKSSGKAGKSWKVLG